VAYRLFRPRLIILFAVALLAAVFLVRSWWLPAVGYALIHDDVPCKADIAVVLAGDSRGHRIIRAAELVRDGYVPIVLVSGPEGSCGFHESDLAIRYIENRGFPAEWFVALPHKALSTREEAAVILPELRRRNVKRFLLVTSNYHSARARRIFLSTERAQGGGPEIRVVAAPDHFFGPDSWWRQRESQKIVFFEWSKTVATVFGL
jgi:uncharacterized SAM-binding protein YcdF (DUF218 family)